MSRCSRLRYDALTQLAYNGVCPGAEKEEIMWSKWMRIVLAAAAFGCGGTDALARILGAKLEDKLKRA